MGTIYKRGRIYWIGYVGLDGKQYCESSKSAVKDDAKRLLQLKEGDIAKNVPVTPAMGRLTFDDAVQDVVNDYTTNGKRSLGELQRRIDKHLLPFFGGRKLTTITTADIRQFIAKRQADTEIVQKARIVRTKNGPKEIGERRRPCSGASNAEINRELAIVKRAFNLAVRAGTIMHKPHVPMLEERNVRKGFFDAKQLQAIREQLPEAVRPVVTFAYITGWRIRSEVLPLQWRQVDLDVGVVNLDPGTTKNKDARTFVVTTELKQLLDKRRTETTALERERSKIIPWVFHRDGERIKTFRGAWQAACESAHLPGRIPHDFRRTAVRNLVRAGIPERVAMQMTGHKTRSVFERYNIVSEADLRDAARKLDAANNSVGAR